MKKHLKVPMGYMNPKVDYAFKLIFGDKNHPEILISLLNSILTLPDNRQIIKVDIANPNIDKRYKDDKFSIMDIHAVANDNTIINIEMQMINRDDMIQRSLYYMSRLMAGQLRSGKDYSELKQTVCINFLDFTLFRESEYAHNEFSYRNERGDLLTDLMQIHFIELPKAESGGIIKSEMLKKWVKFINNPTSKEVDMLVSNYSVFGEAKKILSIANLKEKIRERYYAREDAKREKISWENMKKRMIEKTLKDGIEQGWQQGIEQGMQQGIKQGMQQGIKQGMQQGLIEGEHKSMIAVAHRMLTKGMKINDIIEFTGLSLEEIQNLK